MRTYNFHTIIDGTVRWTVVHADSVREALRTLRATNYEGETVVGWGA